MPALERRGGRNGSMLMKRSALRRVLPGLLVAGSASLAGAAAAGASPGPDTLSVPAGAIKHVMVIDLENESYSSTFGPSSPATYLNDTLLPQGELLVHYYGTGHASLDNYIAQVSGQAPTYTTNSDCISSITSLAGQFLDVTPG